MEDPVISKIKNQFDKKGNPAKIPLMSGKQFFEARSETDGVYVDNLKNQPFLPWKIFSEAVNCLKENGGRAKKGNAINSRLGDPNLGLNTIEGYVASKVYGCIIGDAVFKRITPVASILAWAEICENTRGQICLITEKKEIEASEIEKEDSLAFSLEKNKENSDINSLYTRLESSATELKKLETKLAEKIQRIKELDEYFAGKEEDIDRLKEELEARIGKISFLEKCLSDSKETARILEEKLTGNEMELEEQKNLLQEKDSELRALQEKLTDKNEETGKLESRLIEKEGERNSLAEELKEKAENITFLSDRLSANEREIEKLEESISIKDKDLKTLAGEVIAKAGEMRRLEEKLAGKERKINTMEVMLATGEEKVRTLDKQLSGYEGEEKLAVQIKEQEELIKQLKGTLASKEEAFSKVNEENRKYRMQQKFASDGLRQIEEQKASRKWWKRL